MQSRDLEHEATRLLRAHGAFKRGSGIKSPRMLRQAAVREAAPSAGVDAALTASAGGDLIAEFSALAASARLTDEERQALYLVRIQARGLREAAHLAGTTVWQVRQHLARALHKCRRACSSARALFERTGAEKRQATYHPPRPR